MIFVVVWVLVWVFIICPIDRAIAKAGTIIPPLVSMAWFILGVYLAVDSGSIETIGQDLKIWNNEIMLRLNGSPLEQLCVAIVAIVFFTIILYPMTVRD